MIDFPPFPLRPFAASQLYMNRQQLSSPDGLSKMLAPSYSV